MIYMIYIYIYAYMYNINVYMYENVCLKSNKAPKS